MRASRRRVAWLCSSTCLALAAACAQEPIPIVFDPSGEHGATQDGLHRALDRRLPSTFIKPGARFDLYDDIVVGSMTLAYLSPPQRVSRFNRSSGNFALGPESVARLERILHEALERAVVASRIYDVGLQTGPRTLRLVPHIVDLVYRVRPPSGGSEDDIVLRAGEMTLVLEIFDSETGERLARLAERKAIQPAGSGMIGYRSSTVTFWTALRDVCEAWSQKLTGELRDFHAYSPPPGDPSLRPASSAD